MPSVRQIRRSAGAAAVIAAAFCALPIAGAQQARATISTTARSYTIGDTTVSERLGTARLEWFAPGWRLRFDGTALKYTSPVTSISGNLPVSVQLDYSRRPGDTLTAFARSASQPFTLTTSETEALSTAGSSAVDLQSTALGSAATGGARAAFAFPVGDAVLSIRAGAELEPRPGGTAPVYWRGTTVKGGVALTSNAGDGSFTASLDATRSSADSLGGRNLFPGGGSVTLQLLGDFTVLDPFDPLEDERWPIRAVAFYSRPFDNDRSDQPNLIIPQGSVLGFFSTTFIPTFGGTSLAPSLQYLRESSTGSTQVGLLRSQIDGSAWTMQGGLDFSIPLGARFELTPQAGYAFGSVGETFSQQATLIRRGRGLTRSSAFSDSIRGRYLTIQLSATF